MKAVEQQPNETQTAAPENRGRSVLLGLLGFLLALGVLLLWVYHGFTPVVHGEYGQGVPPASAFFSVTPSLMPPASSIFVLVAGSR